ncbi:MAG: hypothetical protein ACOVRP_09515 [Gemmatimonas sp.]
MATPRTRLPGELVFSCLMLLLSAFLLWAAVDISGQQSGVLAHRHHADRARGGSSPAG